MEKSEPFRIVEAVFDVEKVPSLQSKNISFITLEELQEVTSQTRY